MFLISRASISNLLLPHLLIRYRWVLTRSFLSADSLICSLSYVIVNSRKKWKDLPACTSSMLILQNRPSSWSYGYTFSIFVFHINSIFKKSSLSDQMNNQVGKGPVSSLFVFKKNILRVESSSSKMAIAGALSFLKIINGCFVKNIDRERFNRKIIFLKKSRKIGFNWKK